ncbi:MAG: LysM peptidoglycan-binding domain-containing protein [Propionicimonas sp.]|nr:LysM peptidoglycan-binding domain-containing protein [Propionicimonas sp.]
MRQRLTAAAALLTLGALVAGVPWLLIVVVTTVRIRFDPTTPDGWWQALTTRDNGTLLIWLLTILGAIAWAILMLALVIEIVSRAHHLSVPRLPGLGLPQAIAHSLVAAAVGAAVSTGAAVGGIHALAAPSPAPVQTIEPSHPSAPHEASPDTHSAIRAHRTTDTYTVKKGDTLWDIADDKLGDPYAYPKIFKASKNTVQPDGRHLVNPDLIYPGWKLTIPDRHPADDKRTTPSKSAKRDASTQDDRPTPVAAPTAPATPPPSAEAPTPPAESADPVDQLDDSEADDLSGQPAPLPWMLAGLGGAGALLAGGMWLGLRRRRAVQFRYRRPGRTISVPTDPDLAVVEKTLMHQGDLTSDLVDRVDHAAQRLAAQLHATGRPIPRLLGIDVTFDHLTLRFADPTDLPAPWQPGDDPREWRLPADADLDQVGPWDEEREPVWPTLVTLGQDQHGWRMINLEALGVINLTGDRTYAADLVRYWLAELAVAHWGRDVEIARGTLFEELAPLIRHTFWQYQGEDVIGGLVGFATEHDTWLTSHGAADIDAARAAQAGPELWRPRALITATDSDDLDQLAEVILTRPGRTGTTIIRLADQPPQTGTEIRLTATGRVLVPALGLDLVANGITADEAAGCAAFLASSDETTDAPVPDAIEIAAEWQEHCDAAGHLHADLVVPRNSTFDALTATSVLPEPDSIYINETANTAEDLAEIAPLVPAETTQAVPQADPTLDQDLADWWADSSDRPRLTVLGPVRLRLGRGGHPTVGIKRVAFYTEVAAYLATRPHGATRDELSEALGITPDRVRVDLHTLRARLGPNPATGRPFIPNAHDNPEAHRRNEGVYLLEGLLSDAHLFRRLRLRGEARGREGIDDLAEALRMVTGAPYEKLRRRGGLWLARSRDDQHLLVGIVDVAHLLTSHCLASGDLRRARAAAELARAVAPDEVTPQLDLAAVAGHDDRPDDATRIAGEAASWVDGTGDGPPDLSERADTILRAHHWLETIGGVV